MERCLAVAAPLANESGIPLEQFPEPVEEPEARGGVNIDDGAAFDGVAREVGLGRVEKAKTPGPPAALRVDVGAGIEEKIEHRAAFDSEDRRGIEIVGGIVDARFEFGVPGEEIAYGRDVVVAKGLVGEGNGIGSGHGSRSMRGGL